MKLDDFGNRMKAYEAATEQRLDVRLPICARIDGRRFSRFTRGFAKPFDPDLSRAMRAACAWLVEHTHARLGFVQSDEISLVWQAQGETSSQMEAANVFLWRASDARKNAVSAACRALYPAKAMAGKDQRAMRGMMVTAGVNFDAAYPPDDRLGVFYRRHVRDTEIPEADWLAIPEKHRPAGRIVRRSAVEPLAMPFFGDVRNRVAVVFDGAEPEVGDA